MSDVKLCFVCGVNTNKKTKSDRYNHVAPIKKKGGKYQKDDDSYSESDSDDAPKSKRKSKPSPRVAAVGSRTTRNQNPKNFAVSLCKVMAVPDSPHEPFLQIFSRAHYCGDCQVRIKEAHNIQMEFDKVQAKLEEARADFEIDFSNHLQKIPSLRGLFRNEEYGLYEQDLKLILDYNETEKKIKSSKESETKFASGRSKRQAAVNSAINTKRKLEENGSEDNEEEEVEKPVATKKAKTKGKPTSKYAEDDDFVPEESTSSNTDAGEVKEETDAESKVEDEDIEMEAATENENSTKNGGDSKVDNDTAEAVKLEEEAEAVVEEEPPKPAPPVKTKKDPNMKCPYCPIPRYFNKPENKEEHIAKCHGQECDQCEKRFKSDSELKKHKACIHGDGETKAFICGFCDKEFQLKKYLEDHLDAHPEAKPLNCYSCGRGFPRKESLQKGFQIFKGEPVEPCKNCGKNLNLKDYLEHNKNLKG